MRTNILLTFFSLLSIPALAIGLYILFLASSNKIVYVDSSKIFNAYSGALEAKKANQEKEQQYREQVDTLVMELKAAIELYDKRMPSLSPGQRDKEEEKLREKQRELSVFQENIKQKIAQHYEEAYGLLVQKINVFLKEYGNQKGYDLILIASPTGTIAYARDGLDVTEEVIAALNQR